MNAEQSDNGADTPPESPSNVVQITPELVADLRRKKVLRDTVEDLELESVAGAFVLGELTDPERAVYVELVAADSDVFEWGRELTARTFQNASEAVREVSVHNPNDLLKLLNEKDLFKSPEEAEEYFAAADRVAYLRAIFWSGLRERLQTYATRLSIRSGYKVVRVGWKYHRKS